MLSSHIWPSLNPWFPFYICISQPPPINSFEGHMVHPLSPVYIYCLKPNPNVKACRFLKHTVWRIVTPQWQPFSQWQIGSKKCFRSFSFSLSTSKRQFLGLFFFLSIFFFFIFANDVKALAFHTYLLLSKFPHIKCQESKECCFQKQVEIYFMYNFIT